MKKVVMASIASLMLLSCGPIQRSCANVKGHQEVCISGVVYLQFPSGATVKYTPDGKIATCR